MTKVCPKCSQHNPGEAAYCHNCASPLPAYSAGSDQRDQRQAWPHGQPGGPVIGGQATMAAPVDSQKPMIAMILAILGFLCCGPLFGIPAAILGWMELDAIRNGRSPASGKTMATVGLWGGIAATVFHTFFYVIWFILGLASSSPY